MFNEGACEEIYRHASGSFRLGPEPEWSEGCGQLRSRLGEWRSLDVRETIHCSTDGSVICINGLIAFAKGSYPFQIAWELKDGSPALFWLALGNPRQQMLNWPGAYLMPKPLRPLCGLDFCAS
jgi:hypothetical protein